MSNETALGNALKSAMQSMSKTKQTKMIADHIYGKYEVFKRFKPLALGIEQELQQALPQSAPPAETPAETPAEIPAADAPAADASPRLLLRAHLSGPMSDMRLAARLREQHPADKNALDTAQERDIDALGERLLQTLADIGG